MVESLKFSLALMACSLPDFPRIRPYYRFMVQFRAWVIGLGKNRRIIHPVWIERGFEFSKNLKMTLHANSKIKHHVSITGSRFELGKGCVIEPNVTIDATSSVTIGEGTCVGANCEIYSHTHLFGKKETSIFHAPEIDEPVVIGDGVLLYGHVVVVGGVEIGTGAIVGNGSIVTKKLDEYGIYFGVPARKVDQRI